MTVLYALRQNSQQHAAHPMTYFTVGLRNGTAQCCFDNAFVSAFLLIKELRVHLTRSTELRFLTSAQKSP